MNNDEIANLKLQAQVFEEGFYSNDFIGVTEIPLNDLMTKNAG